MALLLAVCFLASSALAIEGQDLFPDASKAESWPAAQQLKADKKSGEMLEALLDREENKCYGRKCSHSEECCNGAACVDIEGGTCLPVHGKEFYQPCEKDSDCGAGLVCLDSGNFARSKTCQLEGRSIEKKGFREGCSTSVDCDTASGFCCQGYNWPFTAYSCMPFDDPDVCIGPLTTTTTVAPTPFKTNPRLG